VCVRESFSMFLVHDHRFWQNWTKFSVWPLYTLLIVTRGSLLREEQCHKHHTVDKNIAAVQQYSQSQNHRLTKRAM